MEEYIEREALLDNFKEVKPANWDNTEYEKQAVVDYNFYRSIVEDAPTANVIPIRYAYWDYQIDGTHFCSDCGTNALYNYKGKENYSNWCPACGCFMTEVRNKDE